MGNSAQTSARLKRLKAILTHDAELRRRAGMKNSPGRETKGGNPLSLGPKCPMLGVNYPLAWGSQAHFFLQPAVKVRATPADRQREHNMTYHLSSQGGFPASTFCKTPVGLLERDVKNTKAPLRTRLRSWVQLKTMGVLVKLAGRLEHYDGVLVRSLSHLSRVFGVCRSAVGKIIARMRRQELLYSYRAGDSLVLSLEPLSRGARINRSFAPPPPPLELSPLPTEPPIPEKSPVCDTSHTEAPTGQEKPIEPVDTGVGHHVPTPGTSCPHPRDIMSPIGGSILYREKEKGRTPPSPPQNDPAPSHTESRASGQEVVGVSPPAGDEVEAARPSPEKATTASDTPPVVVRPRLREPRWPAALREGSSERMEAEDFRVMVGHHCPQLLERLDNSRSGWPSPERYVGHYTVGELREWIGALCELPPRARAGKPLGYHNAILNRLSAGRRRRLEQAIADREAAEQAAADRASFVADSGDEEATSPEFLAKIRAEIEQILGPVGKGGG